MSEQNDSTTEDEETAEQTSPSGGYHSQDVDHTKTLKIVGGVVLVFFGLAWASIPLYRLVCKSLDPGGSAASNGTADEYKNVKVDRTREIQVRFTANTQGNLPWEFRPTKPSVTVHPGEKTLVKFKSANLDQNEAITGKAVYDINPPEAGPYFKKIECFCFTRQTLEPGETQDMPLYFWLEPDIPDHVEKVTLGYTFFNAETGRDKGSKHAAAE